MTEMLLGQSSPRWLDPWGERLLAPDQMASMVQFALVGLARIGLPARWSAAGIR